jgi:hypothetical protein
MDVRHDRVGRMRDAAGRSASVLAKVAVAVWAISAVASYSCGKSNPGGPSSTTTTTTTTTSTSTSTSTTTTSTVVTSATLVVAIDNNCTGIVTSGADVFLDGQLVGSAAVGRPFLRSGVAFGNHVVAVRERFLNGSANIFIPPGTPTFTITFQC